MYFTFEFLSSLLLLLLQYPCYSTFAAGCVGIFARLSPLHTFLVADSDSDSVVSAGIRVIWGQHAGTSPLCYPGALNSSETILLLLCCLAAMYFALCNKALRVERIIEFNKPFIAYY